MNATIKQQTQRYADQHHRKHNWYRILLILSIITVFCTTYALMMPAITMGQETFCGKTEHQHSDACYKEEKVLRCGIEEESGSAPPAETDQRDRGNETELTQAAENTESDPAKKEAGSPSAHLHSEECYEYKKVLICGQEEHKHTDICYSDKTADVETKKDWEDLASGLQLGDDLKSNLVMIAESQQGYQESTANYSLDEQGHRQGYSRYGAWNGKPYEDWNTSFVSFCLHYAGVKDYPQADEGEKWMEKLGPTFLRTPDTWLAERGNLIFIGSDDQIQVGIVTRVMSEKQQLKAIFGDVDGRVEAQTIAMDDAAIAGYGELPKDEQKAAEDENSVHRLNYEGADYKVELKYDEDAAIPEDAKLSVREIKPQTEEYEDYLRQTVSAMHLEEEPSFSRFFDVTILSEGQKIEPQSKVEVHISYDEPLSMTEKESCKAIHFADTGTELLEATIGETESGEETIRFVQDSFSVIGTVITETLKYVDGQKYILYVSNTAGTGGKALAVKNSYGSNYYYIDAIDVAVGNDGYVRPTTDASLLMDYITWEYKKASSYYTDSGYFYNPMSGQYLNFNNAVQGQNGSPTLSSSAVLTAYVNVGNATRLQQGSTPCYLGYKEETGFISSTLFSDGSYLTVAKVEDVSIDVDVSDFVIKDTVMEDGCLKPSLKSNNIKDTDELTYKWYKSVDEGSTWHEVERKRVTGLSYNVAEDGSWLNVSLDKGSGDRYRVELVAVNQQAISKETISDVFIVPYYDSIQNGSFESPSIPGGKYDEYYQPLLPNGTAGVVWKTTASDGLIEYVNVSTDTYKNLAWNWHNIDDVAEGVQCAELNAKAPGALYQDVLTTPGSTMYWRLAHRGRGPSNGAYDEYKNNANMKDTMYVVIMSTKLAKQYNVTTTEAVNKVIADVKNGGKIYKGASVAEITDDNIKWYYHSGKYTVPDEQYLTRYFFVAGSTAYDRLRSDALVGTVGNHIDDVSFSTELPPPEKGTANLTLRKTIEGLNETDAKTLLNQLSFTITGAVNQTVPGSSFVNFRENDDGTFSADYNISGLTTSSTPGGDYYTGSITVTENTSTAELTGYQRTTTVSSYTTQSGAQDAAETGTVSDTVTIQSIQEKYIGVAEFKNDYDRSPLNIQIRKENQNGSPLRNAMFKIGYLAETGEVTLGEYETNFAYDGINGDEYEDYGYTAIMELDEDPNRIYFLEEVKAPDGYYQILERVYFKLSNGQIYFCSKDGTLLRAAPDGFSVNNHEADKKIITVVNESGVVLPQAGGTGSMQFVVTGILLMLIPLIYLSLKKRGRRERRSDW